MRNVRTLQLLHALLPVGDAAAAAECQQRWECDRSVTTECAQALAAIALATARPQVAFVIEPGTSLSADYLSGLAFAYASDVGRARLRFDRLPHASDALRALVTDHERRREPDRARQLSMVAAGLETATPVQRARANADAIRLSNTEYSEEGLAAYRAVLALEPTDVAAYHALQGMQFSLRQYRAVADTAARRLASVPDDDVAPADAALALSRAGDFNAAKQALDAASVVAKASPVVRNAHGLVLCESGDYDGGIALLHQLTAEAPEYSLAQLTLARCLANAGRNGEADQRYRKAIQHDRANRALQDEYNTWRQQESSSAPRR